MSLQFVNIDSAFDNRINSRIHNAFNIDEVEHRLKEISKDFWSKNIYLISPALMDDLYPPTKRKGIDYENFIFEHEKFEFPKWIKYRDQNTIAIGVYFGNFISKKHTAKLFRHSDYVKSELNKINGASIFICPERIANCTSMMDNTKFTVRSAFEQEKETVALQEGVQILKQLELADSRINDECRIKKETTDYLIDFISKNNKEFTILFLKICLHEMAHHYMSQNTTGFIKTKGKEKRVNQVAKKLIEESFANAFAWSQFSDPQELQIIENFMDAQPYEYAAYKYWIENGELKKCVPTLISAWKYKIDPFIPEYSFEDIEQVLSENIYNTRSYCDLKSGRLNFEYEKKRAQNGTIWKLNEEENFWHAVAKSILLDFNCI